MKKILTVLSMALLSLTLLGAMTSCEGDSYYTGADMETFIIEAEAGDWQWNPVYSRYEAVFDWNEIDLYMYEWGSVTAGLYQEETLPQGSKQMVVRSLPFSHTYRASGVEYTRNFGYDLAAPTSGRPGQIAFYIQDSDLANGGNPGYYKFKVTLIWEQ